jgi:adenine-specific DNA-methyltransferase
MASDRIAAKLLDRLYHGDCRDLLRRLPAGSVDLVVTSPPYNVGKEYEVKTTLDEYLAQQTAVLAECRRVLRPTGSLFWQVGTYVDELRHIPLDLKFFPIIEALGLHLRNRIVWLRPHGLHATRKFSGRHETILWFVAGPDHKFFLDPVRVPQKYPDKKHWKGARAGELSGDPLGKNPGDVWAFRNVRHNHEEHTVHPAQFPCDLVERIVLSTTEPGDVVLDPYMGVGTVALVCRRTGRHFVGAEIDAGYVAVARQRLSGEPDAQGTFPNLQALREYAERRGLPDVAAYSFTRQTGRRATTRRQARIHPEPLQLEAFVRQTEGEAEHPAHRRFRRGS